jgi:hypothetical protein
MSVEIVAADDHMSTDAYAADVAAEPQLVEVTGLSLKYSRR